MKTNNPDTPRLAILLLSSLMTLSLARAAIVPDRNRGPNRAGIVVLDNCDPEYSGKKKYEDNLTMLGLDGRQKFRRSGFNNCESIGSSRRIAADPARGCLWVIENVAHRVWRFNLKGEETLKIPKVHGSALAVDPRTGNVWVLAGEGVIGKGQTVVYDPTGKQVAVHQIPGQDIAYDLKAKAFWIVDRNLTKISAETGKVVFSRKICDWCASSIAVDPGSGVAWVAVREKNRLLKIDPAGTELASVPLGPRPPFRVSVHPTDGSVWVAHLRDSIEHFSAAGESIGKFPIEALTLEVDPGGDVWVATSNEVQQVSPRGKVLKRFPHAAKTSQAWIALIDRHPLTPACRPVAAP